MKKIIFFYFLFITPISALENFEYITCDTQNCKVRGDYIMANYFEVKNSEFLLLFMPGGYGTSSDPGPFSGLQGKISIAVVKSPYKLKPTRNKGYVGARASKNHYEEMKLTAEYFKKLTGKKIILAGHSRGSQSMDTFIRKSKKDKRILSLPIDGIIFSASMNHIVPPKINNLPTLIIHHEKDACRGTNISTAKKLYRSISKNNKSITNLFLVSGGDKIGDCNNGRHMYEGARELAATGVLEFLKKIN